MSANRKWKLSVNWIRDLSCQKGMIWYNWRPVISHCLYLPVYLTLGKSSPGHLIPTLIHQKRSARGRDDNHHQFVRTKWDTQETFLTLWNHWIPLRHVIASFDLWQHCQAGAELPEVIYSIPHMGNASMCFKFCQNTLTWCYTQIRTGE